VHVTSKIISFVITHLLEDEQELSLGMLIRLKRIYGLVWFMPKVALPKIWLAKILVDVLLANELANISYKNELELVMRHWHAK
jgi:hypothetical protein